VLGIYTTVDIIDMHMHIQDDFGNLIELPVHENVHLWGWYAEILDTPTFNGRWQ